jgi:hypothetical protein
MQNERVTGRGGFHPEFRGNPREARQCVSGSGSLKAAPERVICEAVRVKPKLQWSPKDVGDARNTRHLPMRAGGNKWSQPKKEDMWAAGL